MNALLPVDMNKVTRLTRTGRLSEATALLMQGLAGSHVGSAPKPSTDKVSLDFAKAPTGGAWHLAETPAAPSMGGSITRSRTPIGPKLFRSKPAAALPVGASFTTREVRNASGSLEYKLYVPSQLPRAPVPLVVMLHGCTQDPDDFAAGTRMNEHAEAYGFLVAYPAQSRAANASRCWNWFRGGDQHRDHGEPSLIAGVTRQILADHRVQPDRVFIAGLSAGGAAAAVMGCSYPDLYAGVGVHSGLACGAASNLPSALAAMRGGDRSGEQRASEVRTIVFHGSSDRTVSPVNARSVTAQAVAQCPSASTKLATTMDGIDYEQKTWSDDTGRSVAEQWIVRGGGHAWFGGSPAGTFTDPRGPDASREMLRFFGILLS